VADVLIYADTVRSPDLRHEVPLVIPDAFLYVERDGTKHVVISSMEALRLQELGSYELHPPEEYGMDELLRQGLQWPELGLRLIERAVDGLGVKNAAVPPLFPLMFADRLRRNGVELTVDHELFEQRRRVKNDRELAGIRRAQRAAEAGMDAARELLRDAKTSNGAVTSGGEPLTVERIKQAIDQAFVQHGCAADEFIVSHGAQSAIGHHMGEGPIAPNEPIVIDLWPRDRESACFADMTRTFVVGEPSDELAEWHRLCKEALDRALADIRAGVKGRQVFDATCDLFEEHGYPTQRTKQEGQPLDDGFFHGLGHGVGLEVHEQPGLGMAGHKELLAGDVVTVEPGLYRQGYGGCRLEDLVLVTRDGAENLTEYPYDLIP
jgi:Xaa-Pro aminopeptidase